MHSELCIYQDNGGTVRQVAARHGTKKKMEHATASDSNERGFAIHACKREQNE